MPYSFKYTTVNEYFEELACLLRDENFEKIEKYDELFDEFMEFCEVSGSGR